MANLGPLPDGGRVVIVGGGPAGVSCALTLLHEGARTGRHFQITLLEGKQFAGERHHNLGVGVVSPPLPELMANHLGLGFPGHLRLGTVTGYVLHTAKRQILLDDPGHPSYAVRRIQFDQFMLESAQAHGVRVIPARATEVEFFGDRVVVYSEAAPVEADIVVGAFGLDGGPAKIFEEAVGYRPPEALVSLLTRYHPGEGGMARFGPYVHAFLTGQPGVEFGAISPKGDHLAINIAGVHANAEMLRTFLASPAVASILPDHAQDVAADPGLLRVFKGRFPRSLAGSYFGDRYVMVGDAAGLVRAFKGKGVTSGVLTGIRAAQTILDVGISADAFRDHYVRANQDILSDLVYGRAVRLMVLVSSRIKLLDPVLLAARRNAAVRAGLYGAVSAHQPYREVLETIFTPRSMAAVLASMVGVPATTNGNEAENH